MFLISGLERGGTELRLLELARRLPADIEVHLCSTTSRVPLREAFEAVGAHVSVIPIERPWLEWARVRAVARGARTARIAILNTFDLKGALIAAALRGIIHPPPLVIHHLVDLQHGLSRPKRRVLWWLLQRVDAVVCDARSIYDEVIGDRAVRPPVLVIPNGVDAMAFAPDRTARATMRRTLGIGDQELLLGVVANFRPEKNHRLLLEAFRALHREFPQLRLVCVGGGPLLEKARAHALALALDYIVTFTGYVDEVRGYLSAMDVFVLPSLRDAFSNAVLQAMAMEVPCVCARTGEYESLMAGDRHGILFDPTDVTSCIAAIRRVVVDRALRQRLASEGRALVEHTYSRDVMVEAYARLFRTIQAGVARDPHDRQTSPPASQDDTRKTVAPRPR